MVKEKSSIENCLQICRRFQADLDQMQFQLTLGNHSSDSASGLTIIPTQDMTLANTITLSSLKACGLEIADTVSKLAQHQEKTKGRLLTEPAMQIRDQAEAHALEVQRLQHELDSVNQLLSFCKDASSRATPDRVHVLENIAVGDNSQQFCVSTVGDLFKIKGATAGHGSFQFFGSIAAEPLQDIARLHKERHAANTTEAILDEVCGVSSSRGSQAM